MKQFQLIFLSFFGIMLIVAVIVFANTPGSNDGPTKGATGNVVIWGSFPYNTELTDTLKRFNDQYKESFSVTYEFHDPATFDVELNDALAHERAPDVVLLRDDLILRHLDQIELMPYSPTFDQRTFKSLFVQASDLYLRDNGSLALPFAIDPLIMYWNTQLFTNASLPVVPKHWDEFLTMAPKLTQRDNVGNITQSAIAFGEYANVVNAKDILAALMLQVGNPIVKMISGAPKAQLTALSSNNVESANSDAAQALRFYMDFSDPRKKIYSWNRGLPNSRDQFLSGKLAVYFDFASAYNVLKDKNPHLPFDIAPLPLLRDRPAEIKFSHIYGLAVLKRSMNKQTAFVAVQLLLDQKPSGEFAAAFNLPPVRRDLLAQHQSDANLAILYDEAMRAMTWLDPKPDASEAAFREAVESVSSGKYNTTQSISRLQNALTSALAPYQPK